MTFDEYLSGLGLLAKTRRAYVGVAAQAGEDVEGFYRQVLSSRPPIGTVQKTRAALVHFLRFQGKNEAAMTLPPARGRRPSEREGLSTSELKIFLDAVETVAEPSRTILLLLPRTGLRIAEICGLQMDNIKRRGEAVFLAFRGKGDKARVVPLGSEGADVLEDWLARRPGDSEHVFPGRRGSYTPGAVRGACRALRADCEGLETLTPHTLRHTYATRAIAAGLDLARLKALLGHSSIQTTQRYLHPTMEDLSAGIAGIEGM